MALDQIYQTLEGQITGALAGRYPGSRQDEAGSSGISSSDA